MSEALVILIGFGFGLGWFGRRLRFLAGLQVVERAREVAIGGVLVALEQVELAMDAGFPVFDGQAGVINGTLEPFVGGFGALTLRVGFHKDLVQGLAEVR